MNKDFPVCVGEITITVFNSDISHETLWKHRDEIIGSIIEYLNNLNNEVHVELLRVERGCIKIVLKVLRKIIHDVAAYVTISGLFLGLSNDSAGLQEHVRKEVNIPCYVEFIKESDHSYFYGPVREGDTLSDIVRNIRKEYSLDQYTNEQIMAAYYDYNPDAFYGSMHNLNSRSCLSLPKGFKARSVQDALKLLRLK